MNMKSINKVTILTCVALVAVIVAFSACKKDDPKGTKAGKDLCDCLSKATDSARSLCMIDWVSRYKDHFNIDIIDEFEEEEFDIEEFDINTLFKDKTFRDDFLAALIKCDAIWNDNDD